MKTNFQSERSGRSNTGTAAMAWLMAMSVVLVLHPVAARAAATDYCVQSADNVERSCTEGATSDYRLALAKCGNDSVPADRTLCQQQASEDQADAFFTCDEQGDFRDAVCARLGGAPYDPTIVPSNFVATIDNPYFPLKPGKTFVYEGDTPQGHEHVEFAVTFKTRVILGVTCVEVHDSVFLDGALAEDTLDWFAQDKTGNVWYFGENTHEIEDGLITTIDGTFVAGVNKDKPGIIMKAHPVVGDFYRQEFSLDNAEDLAETVSLTESVTVPAGSYRNCLKSQETTPLETDLLEHKFYAPGVGNVLTVDARTGGRTELVRITTQKR